MAISGIALILFVIAHLAGNLQIFLGPEALNSYAAFLRRTGEFLWIARLGLLTMVIVHVVTAISLTLENRAARPEAYQVKTYIKASYASRTMAISGIIVLAYIVYHLLHFTLLVVHPELSQTVDAHGRHDVYRMVVSSFQHWPIALVYIVANFLLGMHLSHGIYSLFQSLGLQNHALRARVRSGAQVIGWGIFIGYAAIPVSVLLGILR